MTEDFKNKIKKTDYYDELQSNFKYELDADRPQNPDDPTWLYKRTDYDSDACYQWVPLQYASESEIESAKNETKEDTLRSYDMEDFCNEISEFAEDDIVQEYLDWVEDDEDWEDFENIDELEEYRSDIEDELLDDLYFELVNENESQGKN